MAGTNGSNGAGASHLSWLRTRHDALTADRTLDYEVPGYDGRLVLRFAPVPWSAIAKTQALATRGEDRDGRALAAANMDVLIAACREVMFRDDAGDLASVDPSGEPHGLDAGLGALLGQEFTTARAALRWFFRDSDVAIAVAAGEVLTWTQRMDAETSEAFVGE
jgi:hypothetical protein